MGGGLFLQNDGTESETVSKKKTLKNYYDRFFSTDRKISTQHGGHQKENASYEA